MTHLPFRDGALVFTSLFLRLLASWTISVESGAWACNSSQKTSRYPDVFAVPSGPFSWYSKSVNFGVSSIKEALLGKQNRPFPSLS